jgi:DNA-binding NarL/FixJ family response regulator
MTNSIRVVLADDHELVRAGFRSLLEKLGALVIGEANNGIQVLQLVQDLQPDIVFMDIAMPELNGLEATARIVQAFPKVRIIILSMHATLVYARRAVRAGAVGYLLKDATIAELEMALHAVARGETYLCSRISKLIVSDYATSLSDDETPLDQLTPRQREILQLISEGHSRKAIAEKLHISVKTFDTYRTQMMDKLGIQENSELVRFATRVGLFPPDS